MRSSQEITRFLSQTRIALEATLQDDDLLAAVSAYGYDAEAVSELIQALDETEAAYQKQQQEYAQQFNATARFDEAFAAFEQMLARHRRLARVAFEPGDDGYEALWLDQARERDFDGVVAQATKFYSALREFPELMEETERFRIDAAAVDAAFESLRELQRVKTNQRVETREAQKATESRNTAVAAMRGRMSDFLEVARVATADDPQLRESLGLTTPA
jgi:hypothetical protein